MADQTKYLNKLKGDRALVIGGAKGIGYGVAEGLIEHGSIVTITGSSEASAQATLEKLHAAYPSAKSRVTAAVLALGDENTLEANIEKFFVEVSQSGKIDHIVFTAGDALAIMPLESVSLAAAKQAGMVRFFAPLLIAKHAAPHFTPGPKSSFTVTTGGGSERPSPNWTITASYLAALHGLTRALAVDLKPVRVNCVSPGAVDTPLWDKLVPENVKQALLADLGSKSATGVVGNIEDVAQTYLGILQDKNITGSIVHTDSGALLL